MLILALDTTTPAGSVALMRRGRILEVGAIEPAQPVATRVPGDLIDLLTRQRASLRDVDVFAVAKGPGSFTGIRIGIATMQGLAFAGGKPLVGVSALEATAAASAGGHVTPRTYVGVWMNAYRGEVYAAPFEVGAGNERLQRGEPIVGTPDAVLRAWRGLIGPGPAVPVPWQFVGDGAVEHGAAIRAAWSDVAVTISRPPLLAGAVAGLAWERARRGEAPPPHAIQPLYVRRPDAELARERGPLP